jgi:hypothetical protein
MKNKTKIIGCIIIAHTFSCVAYGKEISACSGRDFDVVEKEVKKNFPHWKIVDLNDLGAEDRAIWLSSNKQKCPGLAVGMFDGSNVDSYAVTLIKNEKDKTVQTLVVGKSENSGIRWKVLSSAQDVARVSVVRTVESRNFKNSNGHGFSRSQFPSIYYEAIEAGAIAYYWKGGKYNEALDSE